MKPFCFVPILFLVSTPVIAQQRFIPDSLTARNGGIVFRGLLPTDTTASRVKPAPLRLPLPSAGEAHYNAQYKAYKQQQLSGFRDLQAANIYVPPPVQKPNILLRKRPKAPLKTSF